MFLSRSRSTRGESTAATTESVAPLSEEAFNASELPPRLFVTDRYPVQGRINSYSKPDYLLDIAEVLHGTPQFEWLKSSAFGRLFELPVRKSSVSGKLVHQLLCRSLVTKKRHEIWFVFGGQPIRFSLREFAIVTGLNCGQYPRSMPKSKLRSAHSKTGSYLHTLIGPKASYTIQEIVNMLKLDKKLGDNERMDGERRLRLCLIVIVEGVLLCNSHTVKASKKVVEMVKDVEAFANYPWGRKSFKRTLEMVIVGKKVDNATVLASKLMQSHTATHGFTLSFQLLLLQAIPLLERYLPDADDEKTFSDRSVLSLTLLKTFHNSSIIETEIDSEVQEFS